MKKITFDDFMKLDLRLGKVLSCEQVPKSENLLKLEVDTGEEKPRTIVSGIKSWYSPEDLINKYIIVLINLEPRELFGIKSEGMLLAADVDKTAILLKPDEKYEDKFKPGTPIA